jgi:glycosyltransferase involved in cell wall biosynthesis
MKITHINTVDIGGAFVACARLHKGLLQQNIDSNLLTLYKNTNKLFAHEAFKRYDYPILQRVYQKIKRSSIESQEKKIKKGKLPQYEGVGVIKSEYKIETHSLVKSADILHLHWVNGLLDYPSFFTQNKKPIVWTLHDLSPITGGCHYAWDCEKFTNNCNTCPQLPIKLQSPKDVSYQNFLQKKKLFENQKIHIVGNSQWTTKQAQKSNLLENVTSFQTIPLALDTKTFRPHQKDICRDLLGIPDGYIVVGFSAVFIDELRKGLNYLLEAILFLAEKHKICCLSFGAGNYHFTPHPNLFQCNLGKIESEELQAIAYSAADIFVIPSLQESFGQTALEALACATPVIGSNVGGIPDMVLDNQTGYLVPPADSRALANAIEKLILDENKRLELGRNARFFVEEKFNLALQAQRYIALYQKIMNQ